MAVLEVKELTKKYGEGESEVIALDHVSFSVERGEFVAIIGASGSGKSTLMNMIGGIDYPTSGSIIIDGNEIQAMSEDELAIFRRRNLGIVYQFYNLIPTLTAEENIALPWKLDGRKENKELDDSSGATCTMISTFSAVLSSTLRILIFPFSLALTIESLIDSVVVV